MFLFLFLLMLLASKGLRRGFGIASTFEGLGRAFNGALKGLPFVPLGVKMKPLGVLVEESTEELVFWQVEVQLLDANASLVGGLEFLAVADLEARHFENP